MEYVRRTYGVPAKRGMKVSFQYAPGRIELGVITSATHYVKVRFGNNKFSQSVHPTDPALTYITAGDPPA